MFSSSRVDPVPTVHTASHVLMIQALCKLWYTADRVTRLAFYACLVHRASDNALQHLSLLAVLVLLVAMSYLGLHSQAKHGILQTAIAHVQRHEHAPAVHAHASIILLRSRMASQHGQTVKQLCMSWLPLAMP